jgi:hypothetical protein
MHKHRTSRAPRGTNLERFSGGWKGWRVAGEFLIGPTPGLRISVHDIATISLVHAKAERQERYIKELREEIQALVERLRVEQQPPAEDWRVPTIYP